MMAPAAFLNQVVLSALTTGTGTAVDLSQGARGVTVYVEASGTVTGGTVRIEEAGDTSFSGTWSAIQDVTPVTNSSVAVHLPDCYAALRPRITSNITGGATVSVRVVAGGA
jgi:hypothetical protein